MGDWKLILHGLYDGTIRALRWQKNTWMLGGGRQKRNVKQILEKADTCRSFPSASGGTTSERRSHLSSEDRAGMISGQDLKSGRPDSKVYELCVLREEVKIL